MRILLSLALLFSFSTTVLHAQSRVDKNIMELTNYSEKLTDFVGWMQNNETGKWVENNNVIDDKVCTGSYISYIDQNAIWIQTAVIIHEDKKYRVFLYEKRNGDYEYPNIRQGWQTCLETHFFVLTESQYTELKAHVNAMQGENKSIVSHTYGWITDKYNFAGGEHSYNQENLLARITNSIEKQYDHGNKCITCNSQVVDGVEVVRFRMPEYHLGNKTEYFEVGVNEFKKILTD